MTDKPTVPFGAGSLRAFGRLGLSELRAAIYPESNIAQPTEAGMYGTALPQEIQEQRDEEARAAQPGKEASSYERYGQQAANREQREQDRTQGTEPERS